MIIFIIASCNTLANTHLFSKKAELNQVNHQIQELQHTLILDQQQQQGLEDQLKLSETALGQLSQEINLLNNAILSEQQKLTKLKTDQAIVKKNLAQQNTAFAQHIRTVYQLGHLNPFKIILNQDNFQLIERHLTYLRYITSARLELIKKIQITLKELKTNVIAIRSQQNHLKNMVEKKLNQQNNQQTLQMRRQKLLLALHQNVQTKQDQLNTLLANQKALQEIITHLNQQTTQLITSGQPFTKQRGKLSWPLKGNIIANYGSTLDVGGQHLPGIIIAAPEGTPVHAIYPGKVIFANWLRGFGLLIIISHNQNYMSLYGRNHALYVKVGDHVNNGDVIATTGNSGGFDRSSLYFEIRQNGSPINPHLWCI